MSSKKTSNFNLHSWESEDNFLRTEFNENFEALDKVLGEKAQIVAGAYDGNGTDKRIIALGFTPKAVLLSTAYGQMYELPDIWGGLAVVGFPLCNDPVIAVEIVEGGFMLHCSRTLRVNIGNVSYRYLAVR